MQQGRDWLNPAVEDILVLGSVIDQLRCVFKDIDADESFIFIASDIY